MPKVSVIIPIYNVEPYLKECLDSVINQTLKDIEIICVDDCGNDNSMQIVEEYAKQDNRIQIVHHEANQGLGEARNTGIKNATGEYLAFLDSDDFVDLEYYEEMYNIISAKDMNIIYNQNIVEYYENENKHAQFAKWNSKKIGLVEISNNNLTRLFSTPWCKMFKASFIKENNLKFPFKLKHEDEYFNMVSLSINKEIYIINGKPYYYRQRHNSIMKKDAFESFDMIYILDMLFDNFKERKILDLYEIPVSRLIWTLNNHKDKNKFKEKTKEFFNKIYKDIEGNINKLYSNEEIAFINEVLGITKELFLTTRIKLFDIIPLLKIERLKNTTIYKLFDFLPLITIKSK